MELLRSPFATQGRSYKGLRASVGAALPGRRTGRKGPQSGPKISKTHINRRNAAFLSSIGNRPKASTRS
jgi:hypothetical protein